MHCQKKKNCIKRDSDGSVIKKIYNITGNVEKTTLRSKSKEKLLRANQLLPKQFVSRAQWCLYVKTQRLIQAVPPQIKIKAFLNRERKTYKSLLLQAVKMKALKEH